jgi:hypothetical protein
MAAATLSPDREKFYKEEAQRFILQLDREYGKTPTDAQKAERRKKAQAFNADQIERIQAELGPAVSAETKSKAAANTSAEQLGKDTAAALKRAAEATAKTAWNGAAAVVGLGGDFIESVQENGLFGAGKKIGAGAWDKLTGLFEDFDWKKGLGMAGGGVLAWLISSMFGGGGWMGTIVFALLAIPMAIMGKDMASKWLGSDSAAPKKDGPSQQLARGQEVPQRGNGMVASQTSIGAVNGAPLSPEQVADNNAWIQALLNDGTRMQVASATPAQPQAPLAPTAPVAPEYFAHIRG